MRVNITKRVNIAGKGWRFCRVVWKGRKIDATRVLVECTEQEYPEGRF